jgi:hypothetical protein
MTLALSYGISFLVVVVGQLLAAWFLFRGSRTTQTVREGV